MPVEPWCGYIPEVNAGRYEGTGPATFTDAGEMWMTLSNIVSESIAVMTATTAAIEANWHGAAPVAMGAAVTGFMSWLATMEATAAANALSCFTVASAYSAGQLAMIPLPAVNTNRISEAIAEATNFLGVNSGLIAALNAQYAEFWGQNGSTMTTYDEAVSTATIPKPVVAPPPLTSALGADAALGESAAESAADDAAGAASQSATEGFSDSVGAATQAGTSAGSDSSMIGQFASMPTQMLGQFSSVGSSMTQPLQAAAQPLQSLTSPLQSLFTGMGGQTTDPATLGLTGPSAAFSTAESTGGAGLSSGGGGMMMGGGLGGAMMSQSAYMGASGGPVKSQQIFAGVANKPLTLASAGPAGAGGAGGMMPAGQSGASSSSRRSGATVTSVADTTDDDTTIEARETFR